MKKYLFVILFFIFIHSINAQSGVIETIYLKNGSIIKGMIVEIVPNISYTLKTTDGSIIVCNISDIVKITREIAETVSPNKQREKASSVFEKGYEAVAEIGMGAASGKYGLNVIKLNLIYGYRFNPKYFAGVGLGLRTLSFDNSNLTTVLPVFADFRVNFKPTKIISPYASLSSGISFNTASGLSDAGIMVNPEIGFQINKNKAYKWHISLGYDVQQMSFLTLNNSNPFNPYFNKVIRFSESANINFGITF